MLVACAARGGEAGGKDAEEEALHTSRNAFIEVTAPLGQRVKWVSENDFAIVGSRRAETGKVTVRARPGWKLTKPKDGAMESAPGQMMFYAVASDMGEDGGDGEGHECPAETTVVTNHISAPIISMTNVTATAGAILVPQNGVTSITIDFAAAVNIISNGVHQIVTTTTPCFVCTGGEPEERVTTSELYATPSSFKWNWQAGKNSGTKVDGASISTNATVTAPGKHSVDISAVAIEVPDCCACEASASTNALVMQLESETVVDQPTNRKRLEVGVGEDVNLHILPKDEAGETVWEITKGNGKLSHPQEGKSITFTAYERKDTTIVTASINGLSAALTFQTEEPKTMKFENNPNPSGYTPENGNPPGYFINGSATYYVGPDDVNFYKILVSEGFAMLNREGYWVTYARLQKPNHTKPEEGRDHVGWNDLPPGGDSGAGPKGLTRTVDANKGTKARVPDSLKGGAHATPFENGYAYWDIPWYFQVGDTGEQKKICSVIQDFRLDFIGVIDGVDAYKFTLTKGDFSGWNISYGENTPQEAP